MPIKIKKKYIKININEPPKVPVTDQETNKTVWVDLSKHFLDNKLIFLSGVIDRKLAAQIKSLLLIVDNGGGWKNEEYDDEAILLYIINSRGGVAQSGIAIYDMMKAVKSDVYTAVFGLAASTASLILSGGTKKKRLALPHARVMMHQPAIAHVKAPPFYLELEKQEIIELTKTIVNIYAENTEKPVTTIQQDLQRDLYMSATEAIEYGIVDKIVKPEK